MNKTGFILIYILFHFFVLRPVRTQVFSYQTQSLNSAKVAEVQGLQVQALEFRLVYFVLRFQNQEKVLHYKIPFGFFFLVAIFGLIFMEAPRSFYLTLVGGHLLVALTASIILFYGMYLYPALLIVLDMISRYLIPLFSIGILPIAYTKYKQQHT